MPESTLRHAAQSTLDLARGLTLVQEVHGAAFARGTITFAANLLAGATLTINGVIYTMKEAIAAAAGTITFAVNFVADQTVTINGTVFTAKASGATGNQFDIGVSLSASLDALVTVLNASVVAGVATATYAKSGTTILTITYDTQGTAGNAFTLAASIGTVSGATLTGGYAAAGTLEIDLAATLTLTLDNIVTKLNASANVLNNIATYSKSGTTILLIVFDTLGAAGNDFTIASSIGTVSATTLTLGGPNDSFDLDNNGTFALYLEDIGGAIALQDADEEGREITIYAFERTNSGTIVVTPTNLAGGTTLTFDAEGEYAQLKFLAGEWHSLKETCTLA